MTQDNEYDWVDDDSLDLAETQRRFNLLKATSERAGQTVMFLPKVGDTIAVPRVETSTGILGQTVNLAGV